MAKMFYTGPEAAEKLGKTEEEVKALVREGKLREFRDAGSVNYKVADVDKLVADSGGGAKEDSGGTALGGLSGAGPGLDSSIAAAGASASGEIILEPVEEDSAIELAASGSDILSLDEAESGETSAGTKTGTSATARQKEGSSVPSVGVNVFDDDDLDEQVDPLAQTAVSDIAGLGIDGAGSGSGIMELTRESDDTSLGQELLDEIYTSEDEEAKEKEGEAAEMGDATRAGLDEALPEAEAEPAEPVFEAGATAKAPRTTVTEVVEYAPDAVSASLTALLAVSVVVLLIGGLGAVALQRGITPGLLDWIYGKLMIFAGGALGVGVVAAAITYVLAKRSS